MDLDCKTCGKKFKCPSNLSRHGRIHKALRVKCDCGLSFSRKDNLRRHQFMSLTCRALENAADNPKEFSTQTPALVPGDSSQNEDKIERSSDEVIVKRKHK